jgi:gamma-glutamyltranspeptidase/glutathione hydrolase
VEGFPIGETPGWGRESPQYLHTLIESIKLASADRAVHKRGRPAAASGGTAREGYETPIDALLGKDYAAARRKLIDPAKARPIASHADRFTPELLEGDGSVSVAAGDPLAWYKAQGSTTHFDVVDKDGNVFGCTHSLGNGFGSGLLRRGNFVILLPNSRLYGESLYEQQMKVTNDRRSSSKHRHRGPRHRDCAEQLHVVGGCRPGLPGLSQARAAGVLH